MRKPVPLPLLLTALLPLAVGCGVKPSPLPSYPWVNDATAIRRIAERAASIKTVSATCGLTLTRADGERVTFDGILLAAPPAQLRLQASKFGQKLFDLTLNSDGLFIRMDDPSRKERVMPASLSAAQFVREWSRFNGGLFEATDLETRSDTSTLTVMRNLPDGRRIACDIEKPTLTPRRYRMLDAAGVERFTLEIPEYRLVNGIVYPAVMDAHSDQGAILIQLRDVDLNGELTPQAFRPPPNAQQQP